MSRLTDRFGQNATTKEPCYIPAGMGTKDQVVLSEIVDKLGRLEDLEEAGRLIELPCKTGDMVYYIDREYKIKYGTVSEIVIGQRFYWLVLVSGKDVLFYDKLGGRTDECFLTKAEAEAKLAELKGGAE